MISEIEENSKKLEASLIRIMGYLQQFCGSSDIRKMVNMVQDGMVAVRSLQRTIELAEASTPGIGWVMLAASYLNTAFAVGSIIRDVDPYVSNYTGMRGMS